MTQLYCDHGCTLYPTAYMSTPASAASLPQEGDGLASGTGTTPAVAVATMDFSASTASAGASFAVQGAALTCVASGASTTQFNAGAGAVLAANLAAAINAATAVPTTTTAIIGGLAPYLKALVWASAAGAVLTVYTRIASSLLNTSSNASAILSCGTLGSWAMSPANASFTGGVSGPWAAFINPTALAAAVSAAISGPGTYGAFSATVMSMPAGGDTINVRTGRGGANIQILLGSAAWIGVARAIGSASAYLEYKFDNGVVWPGSSNIFEIVQDGPSTVSVQTAGYSKWTGQMQSGALATAGGQPNFRLSHTYANMSGYVSNFRCANGYGAHHTVIEGLEIADTGAGTSLTGGWALNPFWQTDPSRPTRVLNSRFGIARSVGTTVFGNGSYPAIFEFEDCHIACGGATTYNNVIATTSNSQNFIAIRMLRPKFTGGGGGHHGLIAVSSAAYSGSISLAIEDPIDLGGFLPGDVAASLCGRITASFGPSGGSVDLHQYQSISSPTMFLHDTARRIIEWRPVGMPTTGLSILADGATPYVLRFGTVHSGLAAGLVTRQSPQRCIKQSSLNTLGSGTRTLTQHMLIDANYGGSAYTPTNADWWIEGAYLATDGTVKTFSTKGAGAALAADTQAWSSLTFAPFAGLARTFSRWKMTAPLPLCLANAIVTCYVVCATQPLTLSEWAFVDPQFELS